MHYDDIPWHPNKWRGLAKIDVHRQHPELTGDRDKLAHLETLIGQRATQLRDAARAAKQQPPISNLGQLVGKPMPRVELVEYVEGDEANE